MEEENVKKKTLAMILAIALILTAMLCGCKSSATTETQEETTAAASSETQAEQTAEEEKGAGEVDYSQYRIACAAPYMSAEFAAAQVAGIEARCKELGVNFSVVDADYSAEVQTNQLEQLIAEGDVDAIICGYLDEAMEIDTIKAAIDAGIVFVLMGTDLVADVGQNAACMPNKEGGMIQMQTVVDQLDGKGNIAIMLGPLGQTPTVDRRAGYEEVLAQYPDVKVTFEQTANWGREEAMALMENWLQTGEQLDAVVCENDEMAIGAANVLQDAGLTDVIVAGLDGISDAYAAVADGSLSFTLASDATGSGRWCADIAIEKIINGGEPSKWDIPWTIVNADNVAEYLK